MGRRRDEQQELDSLVRRFMGLTPRQRMALVIVALIASVMIGAYYWEQNRRRTGGGEGQAGVSVQMLLGNPSAATGESSNRDNYLMVKPFYALSHNNSAGGPNWVSWRVTRDDLGSAPRKAVFDSDALLPPGFRIIVHKDYTGSGFDRGHLCPHSDRAASVEMSYATFVMTNIIPQAPNLNRKAWAQLEMYCRELVQQEHDRLYIVAGPAGRGGKGSNGSSQTIGGGKVAVPAECWKVIVVVSERGGEDDLAKIDAGTRVIAVDMPNDNDAVGEAWAGFRTSVAEIEKRTGYRFFDRVRPEVAEKLRVKVDGVSIPAPRPIVHGGD